MSKFDEINKTVKKNIILVLIYGIVWYNNYS